MLVIRRRAGECLLLGENTEVEVLEIEGSQVKLGIRAPKEVLILRKEIFETSQANRSAARNAVPAGLAGLLERLR
jgi:carbon storage regulator